MSRIGRKVALLIVEHELRDNTGEAFLATAVGMSSYPELPLILLAKTEDIDGVRKRLGALEHPYRVFDRKYEKDTLARECRELLSSFFAKREKRDSSRFAKLLSTETKDKNDEPDWRHASNRLQVSDFRAGLFRTPWKSDDELVTELVCRIGDILDLNEIRVYYNEGEVILEEGQQNECLYLIERGVVDMFKVIEGEEIVIGELTPGKFVGTLSFIEGKESFARTVAVRPTTLLKLGNADFKQLLTRDAGLASLLFNTISRAMAGRIRQQSELQLRVHTLNKQLSRDRDDLQAALERLDRAQMKLLESERMALLGEFVAGIAHELNNPAGALIRGSEQLSNAVLTLFEGVYDFSAKDLAVIRRFGLLALKGAIVQPPRPLNDIRSDIRRYSQQFGDTFSRETLRLLAELHLSEEASRELSKLFRDMDEDERVIRRISMYHHIGQGIRHISVCGERISAIVTSLRSYSRPDKSEAVEVSVTRGIDDTLLILAHLLKHITVQKRFEDAPKIQCRPAELNQVWTNLIANAAEAMGGKGTITIRVSSNASKSGVIVDIIDNGPGISPENIVRIWDVNFTTKVGPASFGLGLGLAISKGIVERHGGTISVESRPGQTWFRIMLPLTHSEG